METVVHTAHSPSGRQVPELVSVIIPTFNRVRTLPRAIDSVLGQTYPHFEILVVDDGSTDDTAEFVNGYADLRVHYLRQLQNQGVAAARNRGLREGRGAFFAFLDSDDEWFPEKLAAQVANFREQPEDVGLSYTGVESVFLDGSKSIREAWQCGHLFEDMLLWNRIHGGGSNAMIRRSVYETVGGFDEDIPGQEDYEYWIRISERYQVACVREPLIRYYDMQGADRRSLDARSNLDALLWLYGKYGAAMRKAGVAHRFLMNSAQRHLVSEPVDPDGALRLVLAAVRARPFISETYPLLGRVVLRKVFSERTYDTLRSVRRADVLKVRPFRKP